MSGSPPSVSQDYSVLLPFETLGEQPMRDAKLTEAAALDSAQAQYELAVLLMEESRESEASQWMQRAAAQGFGPAQYRIAMSLRDPGDQEERDLLLASALAWYEERAQGGDPEWQFEFALVCLEGEFADRRRAEGLRWLRTSADAGKIAACRRLGLEYLKGEVSPEAARNGVRWLSKSADLGDVVACRLLGDLYLIGHAGSGQGSGKPLPLRVTRDMKLALAWYERAISGGDMFAAYVLGNHYLQGEYLDQNLAFGEKWLLRAATAGLQSAELLLGKEYLSGDRLPCNASAAIHWLSRAALSDRGEAQVLLGEIYRSGKIVPKDPAQAFKWLSLAATASPTTWSFPAIRLLAAMCADGEMGMPDLATAGKLYGRIASRCWAELRKDHPNPSHYEFVLAGLHEAGEGVAKDLNHAIKLYERAAKHSHGGAISRLKELAPKS